MTLKILLVDDEPELVYTLQERLELRGYAVDALLDGAEAIARVKREHYDVLVLDVKMPGMGGYAVLESVRRIAPRLPLILLTGHGDEGDERETSMPECSCAYLYKPVKLEELIATIKDCVGGGDHDAG